MERVNQEIEAYLSIYCASHPEEWPQALHTLEFTHNSRCHADRQNTPFELMFGKSPFAIPLSFKNTKYSSIEERWNARRCRRRANTKIGGNTHLKGHAETSGNASVLCLRSKL